MSRLALLLERLRLSPVAWANLGPLGRLLAAASRPTGRPILILSHPRSGSTWAGSILGMAAEALYLKEPVTLSHIRRSPGPVAFEFLPGDPPRSYVRASAAAGAALPSFPPNVVPYPGQWTLRGRRDKRLVIKEVNPLALGWFIQRWDPIVIYLVRHPAAVASSFMAQGWRVGRKGFERRFSADRLASGEIVPERHLASPWNELGAVQAITLKLGLAALRAAPAHLIMRYEELCSDPLGAFRQLYDFAGLRWSGEIEQAVRRQSGAPDHDRSDTYGTTRNSARMANAWREELTPDAIAAVRAGYLAYDPPFYREDWPALGYVPKERPRSAV